MFDDLAPEPEANGTVSYESYLECRELLKEAYFRLIVVDNNNSNIIEKLSRYLWKEDELH